MNFFKESTLTSENGKVYVNIIGDNKILLPEEVVARFTNIDEYLNTGKTLTLGVRPEDIYANESFVSANPETTMDVRIEVVEKLGAETQVYCELDYQDKESSVVDNSTQMIARISNRAVVALKDVVTLSFDADHIHMFDGETEATMLERDAGYEVIEENAEGSSFVPPTPQEMREKIDAARVITKEMKAQMRKDAKAAKKAEAATAKAAAEAAAAEEVAEEAPVEEPADEE
jgi:hypothetical protein